MSYLTFKSAIDTKISMLSPVKTPKMPRIFRETFQNNISPSEHRLLVQRPSLLKHTVKPKEDLEVFKKIIEKSLNAAKTTRLNMQEVPKSQSRDASPQVKDKVKYKNKDHNTTGTFIKNRELKSKKVFKKSFTKENTFLKVTKCKSKVFLKQNYNKLLTTTKISDETDEDKLDYNLDMYC
ncbi:hypothetical protein SteCoe_26234 [Stentor coeruleus]|uniref:Uncharacterized protein n=1 Tax=Stentor coeruleus TaxID=5963 RepID=A0A1R2BDB3_9CILI|nr:hypothetical protein SteCoe_26234 [Stentor coeruleus]